MVVVLSLIADLQIARKQPVKVSKYTKISVYLRLSIFISLFQTMVEKQRKSQFPTGN
jgi:hypothetical protein